MLNRLWVFFFSFSCSLLLNGHSGVCFQLVFSLGSVYLVKKEEKLLNNWKMCLTVLLGQQQFTNAQQSWKHMKYYRSYQQESPDLTRLLR